MKKSAKMKEVKSINVLGKLSFTQKEMNSIKGGNSDKNDNSGLPYDPTLADANSETFDR